MAMYTMLRRASSSVLPQFFRAAGSPRTFNSALCAVRTVERADLTHECIRRIIVPYVRFANSFATKTSADEKLIQILESEIDCANEEEQSFEEIPRDFPFEIEDRPGDRTILLKRKYGDETITVQVDIVEVEGNEDEDEDKDEGDHEENPIESSFPLVVSISKGNRACLEFGLTAYTDEIVIDSLSIKQSENSEEELPYEGPDFHDLDENLQKSFHKYLEIRGIKPSITNVLHGYMTSKENREYTMWLNNLKNFIEK
ncbi:hypothetical protein L6164_000537 [Bauhinia variegata]|uniref:Uncharacterized protein n=1 Tax=Bauhinia variegata TaxID=167791 RepID=A0ACB9Q6T0_BAUVA|nr:hypothetical protein L6164_000537 [Bauhinia variegata]